MGITALAAPTHVTTARAAAAPTEPTYDQGPTLAGIGIGAAIGAVAGPGLGYLQLRSTGSVPSSVGGKVATAAALAVAGALMLGLGGGVLTDVGRSLFAKD